MTIKEATIATLEDKRADYMDAVEGLKSAVEALHDWKDERMEALCGIKFEIEQELANTNSALRSLEPPDRFTGYDN